MRRKFVLSILTVVVVFGLLSLPALAAAGAWHSFTVNIHPYGTNIAYTASQRNEKTATTASLKCTGLTYNAKGGGYNCMLYSDTVLLKLMGIVHNSSAQFTSSYPSGYGGAGTYYRLGFQSARDEPQGTTLKGTWRHDSDLSDII